MSTAVSGRPVTDGARQKTESSRTAPAPARPGAAARKVLSPPVGGFVIPQLSGLPDSRADADTMVAHFIDVGQGDATLLEFQCGAILVDTGGEKTDSVSGRERLVTYLEEFFQRRSDLSRTLNLVVLSHPHLDHTDGVAGILDMNPAVVILNVLDNGTRDRGSGISGQKKLQQYARDNDIGYVGLAEADITTLAGVTNEVIDPPMECGGGPAGVDPVVTALWGRVDLDAGWANDANNDSVVLRVDFGESSFLFMGDMEAQGIDQLLDSYADDPGILDSDVLKVGHHGSHNGTTSRLVATVKPEIAIAQSGDSRDSHAQFSAWAFGHPHRDAVNLLRKPAQGVGQAREAKYVRVGIRGRNPSTGAPPQFTNIKLTRAVYNNGWDGNVAVTAKADGTMRVQVEF
jgi:competence protein ComEC